MAATRGDSLPTERDAAGGRNFSMSLSSCPPVSSRYIPLTPPNQKPEGSLIKSLVVMLPRYTTAWRTVRGVDLEE